VAQNGVLPSFAATLQSLTVSMPVLLAAMAGFGGSGRANSMSRNRKRGKHV
jgi:hypothetical protein